MELREQFKNMAYPRQVIMVTSEAEVENMGRTQEKQNIFTLAWHIPLSFEPLMYGIAVGKERFSYKLIDKSKVFAVNFMSVEHEKQALFCGRHPGQNIDKFKETGFTPIECDKIHCPRIKEALAWLECEVVEQVEVGDHYLIIGKVLGSGSSGKGKRLFSTKDGFTTTIDG